MKQVKTERILKDMPADLVKALLIMVVNSLYCNPDIELAMKSQEMEDFIEENDIKLPFSQTQLVAPKTIELYKKIFIYSTLQPEVPEKIKCSDPQNLLREIIENDELFEILALTIMGQESEDFVTELGYGEKYEKLKKDKVFLARNEYMTNLIEYCHAVVNLYGVIHITELAEMIDEKEQKQWRRLHFQRLEGFYPNTVLFTPEFFSAELFGMIVENCFTVVPMSFDGFLLHGSFGNQCIKENALLQEYLAEHEGEDLVHVLDSFWKKRGSQNSEIYIMKQPGNQDIYRGNCSS